MQVWEESHGIETMSLAFEKIGIKVDASGHDAKTAGIPTKVLAVGVK